MDQRKSYRTKINRTVAGRIPATPITVTVLDLSTGGCAIEIGAIAIPPGTTILLELSKKVEAGGRAVWSDAQRIGVEFYDRLTADELLSVLRESRDDVSGDEAAMHDQFGRELPPLSAQMRVVPD
jgi:hypothetical protein